MFHLSVHITSWLIIKSLNVAFLSALQVDLLSEV